MAAVSLLWNNNMAAVTSCENALCLFWAPNGLNELPEMRFEFPLILIGKKPCDGFFSRPIMPRTQLLAGRLGPKKRILALFRRRASPELSFVCGAG